MAKFLSQEWFDKVAELNNQAGELPLSPAIEKAVFNLQVLQNENDIKLHLKSGKIAQNFADNAQATVRLDDETLAGLIAGKDIGVVLEAFMTGKIRIDGDMSAVLALQSAKPSTEQKALYKQILAVTEF